MIDINKTLKGIEQLQNQTIGLINENLSAEMYESLKPEQKKMVDEARKGINFKNIKSSEKLSEITQILQKNGF